MTCRARGTYSQILGRVLLSSAALGGLMIGPLGATAPAHAEIGLAPSKRGTAYITFKGGYQHRNGAAAVAPSTPAAIDPLPGFDVEAQAIASPNLVSSKARIEQSGRSAEGSASATSNSATSQTTVHQQFGDKQGEASSSASASADATAETNTFTTQQDANNFASSTTSTSADAGPPPSQSAFDDSAVSGTGVAGFNGATAVTNSPTNQAAAASGSVAAIDPSGATIFANASTNPPNADMQAGFTGTNDGSAASAAGTAGQNGSAFAIATTPGGGIGTQIVGDVATVSAAANETDSKVASAAARAVGGPDGVGGPEGLIAETFVALDDQAVLTTAFYDGQAQAPFVRLLTRREFFDPILFDLANETLEADDGAFGGFSFGYVFVGPILGLIDRFEAYGTHARNEDDEIKQSQAFTGVSADGQAIVTAINTKGLQIETDETLTQTEFGMRFKSDRLAQGILPLIVSLEPFYMNYEQESGYGLAQVVMFESTVDADLWGGQVALESEIPLIAQRLHWVGRVAGGVYWMDADGDFSNSLTGKTLGPGIEETGYRLGAETGLRLFIGPHAFLTATGAADHLSEAPRAVFRGGLGAPDDSPPAESLLRGAGAIPARVESDELTNYRANLRLTFTTRSHEPVAFK